MEQVESQINPPRELAAIMFSDVVGFTAIMGRDEREGLRTVREHRARLREVLPRFNGRLIGEIGDGTLSSFHSAVDAVNCARELQATLVEDPELRLRIGIHVGDVVFTDNTVLGDGVNIASRLNAIASPGGVCISERVYEEIRNKPEIEVKDLGEKKLKNVARPVRVYALQLVGEDLSARSWIGRRLAIGAIISAVIVAIAAAYVYRAQIQTAVSTSGPVIAGGKVTLAVLPFANLSANKDDEYFSDGITDEIRGDLSKIAGLQVIARTSSFAFKGQNEDVKKIARLLNVRNVLEGSVRKSTDRVRIDVELIDASSGFTVWSQQYDRNMADIFAIQSEVAEGVAVKLRASLLPTEKARLERRETDSLVAYNLYLQGLRSTYQGTDEGRKRAIDCFSRAISEDPNFARAYLWLAAAYAWASDSHMAPRDAMPKVRTLSERALALDSALGGAHANLGSFVYQKYEWDWPAAERELQIAVKLDPDDPNIRWGCGWYFCELGRADEGIREMRTAHELDPLSPLFVNSIGDAFWAARQYDSALDYHRQSIDMAPDYWLGYFGLGWTYLAKREPALAVVNFEKAVALTDFPITTSGLAAAYAAAGRRADAKRVLHEKFEELSKPGFVEPALFAPAYFFLGDKDRAFELLDEGYRNRSGLMSSLNLPFFDAMRSDARFTALVKKVGLPD